MLPASAAKALPKANQSQPDISFTMSKWAERSILIFLPRRVSSITANCSWGNLYSPTVIGNLVSWWPQSS